MNIDAFTAYVYDLFANFDRPLVATNTDCCEECRDHNDEVAAADRRELSVKQIGTVEWGITTFLLPQAMGYYLPRFVELAIKGENDKFGEPYMCTYINQIGLSAQSHQYDLLSNEQRQAVCDSLKILKRSYYGTLEEYCWDNEIDNAIRQWST